MKYRDVETHVFCRDLVNARTAPQHGVSFLIYILNTYKATTNKRDKETDYVVVWRYTRSTMLRKRHVSCQI